MSYRFHPPRENPLVIGAVNILYPVLLGLRERVVRVRIPPDDWRHLQRLRDHRALLLPNHPSETEPSILVSFARRLGQPFHYVATHEIFHGPTGWVVCRMGAFSVRRGWPDRAALRMSRRVLAERDRKLVMFPEGETHMQGDLILPLHKGAVQIGFWSLEHLEKIGKPVTLPVVPVAIKYRYVGDPCPALLRGIERLEEHLGLPVAASDPLRDRVRRAGVAVLSGVEREYGIKSAGPQAAATVDQRIAALHDLIAARVTNVLNVPLPAQRAVQLRMRALFNAVFDYLDGLAEGTTPYQRRLHRRRVLTARACLNDLWRVQNFMAISEDCLRPPVAAEQIGEVLFRLEKEVYGRARTRPWREALVRLGPPLELADWLPAYRAGRKAAVARCTAEVENRLRALLESLPEFGAPL